MRKHNEIHTLGAPHYKAHFRFLRKWKDSKCALWSEKYGSSFVTAGLSGYRGSRVRETKGNALAHGRPR